MLIYLSRKIERDRINSTDIRCVAQSEPLVLNPSWVSATLRAYEEVISRFRDLQAASRKVKANTVLSRLFCAYRNQRSDPDLCCSPLCHAGLCAHHDARDCEAER